MLGLPTINKTTSLAMAEHVRIRNFGSFMKQVYDLLNHDGVFVSQVSRLRKPWQYEDLIWGLTLMKKNALPVADASTPLG